VLIRPAGRSLGRFERAAARAALAAAIILFVTPALPGAADAQQSVRPEINPGQVQKRIPLPPERQQEPPELRVPAPAAAAPAAPLRFVLTGVVIDGATAFSPAALAPAYEPYLAREIGRDELQKILRAITDKYRTAGYFLSRAVAPPQPLTQGILRIRMIEGYVRRVRFENAEPDEAARLSLYFTGIVGRRPARLPPLERALLLVNDIPGLQVAPRLDAADERNGVYDLILHVRRRRIDGFASLDNRGTESLGPWETQLSASVNSLLSAFDRLQLSIFDTPNRPRELVSPEIFYGTPLDSRGTRLGLSVARTSLRPGGSLAAEDFDATAMRYAAQVTHPLLRSRDRSLWLGGGFDVLDSAERSGDAPVFDDHLRVLRVSANYADNDDVGNSNLAEIEVSQGLGFLGASQPSAVGLSRSGGRADFTKVAGSVTRRQMLGGRWGAQVDLAGQKSAAPLLLPEQFALGGARFGRAYDPAEIAGDDALAGSFELRYGGSVENPVLRSYQLYGFYDVGVIWNMEAGGAVAGRQSLASFGGGTRLALTHTIAANLELAKALTRQVAAENGKPLRAFFSISASF
jgi:hemolysin activation/secretion protein